jgi:hypothetical protein
MENDKPVVLGMPAEKEPIPATEFTSECRCCVSRFRVSNECINVTALLFLTFFTMICLLQMAQDTSVPIRETKQANDAELTAFILSNFY